MASQAKSVAIAHGAHGDLLSEQARTHVLLGEFRTEMNKAVLVRPGEIEKLRRELSGTTDPGAETIRNFLLQIPLPTIYFKEREQPLAVRECAQSRDDAPAPLVCAIAFLDHAPLVTPQLIKADLLYPLAYRLKGLTWPDGAKRLRVDLLTTCPGSEFSVSDFVLDRPKTIKDFEYEGEVSGQIKFNTAQSSLLDDLVFVVRAAFELPDGGFQEIPVIGHHELRLRVTNQQNHPLISGNRRLDRHVEELLTRLLKECPSVRDELDDLLPMLQALTLLLSTYAQEAIYKGRSDVSEPEFQTAVIRDLRNQLGQDVQEHPGQAGGITDIRFRGVIVELKVEKQRGERQQICQKYTAQSAQYAGVEARQVSVLLVLDVTAKDRPPGDIRNDILLTDVETHGETSAAKLFPSKAFVFVVNGNMKSPSEYSK
ncbi:MAG: hypothetical protein HQ518_29590 [Rhodopirellula sp.]|nr:hypothetical protein [Rhodopirellula sp.]